MTITEAPEPSNIVWEHQDVTKFKQRKRGCYVTLAISVFIFMTFLLFTFMKGKAGENKSKYPSRIKCEFVDKEFADDLTSY